MNDNDLGELLGLVAQREGQGGQDGVEGQVGRRPPLAQHLEARRADRLPAGKITVTDGRMERWRMEDGWKDGRMEGWRITIAMKGWERASTGGWRDAHGWWWRLWVGTLNGPRREEAEEGCTHGSGSGSNSSALSSSVCCSAGMSCPM